MIEQFSYNAEKLRNVCVCNLTYTHCVVFYQNLNVDVIALLDPMTLQSHLSIALFGHFTIYVKLGSANHEGKVSLSSSQSHSKSRNSPSSSSSLMRITPYVIRSSTIGYEHQNPFQIGSSPLAHTGNAAQAFLSHSVRSAQRKSVHLMCYSHIARFQTHATARYELPTGETCISPNFLLCKVRTRMLRLDACMFRPQGAAPTAHQHQHSHAGRDLDGAQLQVWAPNAAMTSIGLPPPLRYALAINGRVLSSMVKQGRG